MRNGTDARPRERAASRCEEQQLRDRIFAEYREMPGLALTLRQASRLFRIEPDCCARILSVLVERGVLVTTGRRFVRAGSGR